MFDNLEKIAFNLFILVFFISSLIALITSDLPGMVFPVLWSGFCYFLVYVVGGLFKNEQ